MFKQKSLLLKIMVCVISLMLVLVGCSSDVETGGDDEEGKSSVKKSKVEVNFDDPEKAIEQTVVSSIVDTLGSYVENSKNFDYGNMSVDATISVTLGSDFGTFIDTVSGQPGVSSVVDSIGLKSASVSAKLNRNDTKLSLGMDSFVNNKKIIGGNAVLSADDEMVFLSVPDLADGTVGVDGSEFMGDFAEALSMIDEASKVESTLLTSLSSALNEDELSDLLSAYAECAIDSLGDPTNGEEEIEACGVSKKVEYISYDIDDETVRDLFKAVLEKVQNDAEFRSMFISMFPSIMDFYNEMLYTSYSYGDYSDFSSSVSGEGLFDEQFLPAVNELLGTLDEIDFDEVFSVKVYYSDNALNGFAFSDNSGEEYMSVISLTNGNDVGAELNVDGMTVFSFDGTVSSGKYTGDLSIGTGYEAIKLGVEDFDLDKLINKGELHGTLVLTSDLFEELASDSNFPANFSIKISLDSNPNSYCNIGVSAFNGTKSIIDMKLEVSVSDKASKVSVPTNYISADSEDMNAWASELQTNMYTVLFDNLKNAGINSEMLTSLASLG